MPAELPGVDRPRADNRCGLNQTGSIPYCKPCGVSGTPALFIIDRKGVIAFSFGTVSVVTVDELRRKIAKVSK